MTLNQLLAVLGKIEFAAIEEKGRDGKKFTRMLVPSRKRWRPLAHKILDYYGGRRIAGEPLPVVAEILSNEANRQKLAPSRGTGISPEQWDTLVREITRARRQHEPSRPKAPDGIRTLAEHLIEYWEGETGETFSVHWLSRGKIPLSAGTRYLHAVFKLIDPDALRWLPTVTKQIVADRNRATCKK